MQVNYGSYIVIVCSLSCFIKLISRISDISFKYENFQGGFCRYHFENEQIKVCNAYILFKRPLLDDTMAMLEQVFIIKFRAHNISVLLIKVSVKES